MLEATTQMMPQSPTREGLVPMHLHSTPTRAARFWSKVRFDDKCWIWQGAATGRDRAYGYFWDGTRPVRAHRWAYEFCIGPIPEGLTLDHLCCIKRCVNPDHLEAVTRQVNILRGTGLAANNARKIACPSGHPYLDSNLILYRGWRYCRTCRNAQKRDGYWRKKQSLAS